MNPIWRIHSYKSNACVSLEARVSFPNINTYFNTIIKLQVRWWWHTPLILALGKQKPVDFLSLRPAWFTEQAPAQPMLNRETLYSKTRTKTNQKEKKKKTFSFKAGDILSIPRLTCVRFPKFSIHCCQTIPSRKPKLSKYA